MLIVKIINGGKTYCFATKQHNEESFKECLYNVGLGNTKLIIFHDEYTQIDVSVSPLSSVILYKEE